MKIGFIGAGKVGFSLGKFFVQGKIPVTGYSSRQRESAREAASFTNTTCYDNWEALVQDSDAIFLTVPDGMISSVYQQLKHFKISGKIICHCSGALAAGEAFPDIAQTGACGYSVHPLFPVNSKYDSYRELAGAFFCLEGEGPHLPYFRDLLTSLGASVQIISPEGKRRYHAACCVASNLMCALAEESLELLTSCGFSEEMALKAITPLMRSNLEHIVQSGPVQALTGPVERCDTSTVAHHLSCLPDDGARELYRLASCKLVEIASRKNPDRDYRPMERLLNDKENIR